MDWKRERHTRSRNKSGFPNEKKVYEDKGSGSRKVEHRSLGNVTQKGGENAGGQENYKGKNRMKYPCGVEKRWEGDRGGGGGGGGGGGEVRKRGVARRGE